MMPLNFIQVGADKDYTIVEIWERLQSMIKRFRRPALEGICLLGMLLTVSSLPGWARPPVPLDYQLMSEEFQAAGGIQFFSKTEELLRLADFEQALMRYRFLKGQVGNLTGYRPLVVNIDRRLKFLQKQMRLAEADIQPLPRLRVSRPAPPRLFKKKSRKAAEPQSAKQPPQKAKGNGSSKAVDQQSNQTQTALPTPEIKPSGQSKAIPIPSEAKPTVSPGVPSPDAGKSRLATEPQASSPVPAAEAPLPEKTPASPEDKTTAKVRPPPQKSFLGWLKSFLPGK